MTGCLGVEAFPIRKGKRYFSIQKANGRFFLKDPTGKPFFSIGLNHIDSATLRYPENGKIWQEKYQNSLKEWLTKDVSPNLKKWGFNTVGWTQEVVNRGMTNHRHSRNFTAEEYRWLNMPYCHMLHFADFHQWDAEVRHPDFFSQDFRDWCDYVARDEAARLADDPNLIGYFYLDCPIWVHTTNKNKWKGPIFDPELLRTESGKKELSRIARQYYKVTHEAVRRYDTNHLILGDRYEASKLLSEEVIQAALPYVDVLSFQHFSTPPQILQNLDFWYKKTGLPTLVADCSHAIIDKNTGHEEHTSQGYEEIYTHLRKAPSCIGYHLCGAYLENRVRKKGLLTEQEKPNDVFIQQVKKVNLEMEAWVSDFKR
ncbi:agarase [Larkinella punicea]|uniref:Agarase n=2 Tax=Larkinella punicea TaxID=2315727 RepID=A0A368JLS6_9BACT|nr:agarase [Larkinella punicea]